jgi:formylglycine-generating enzyme required for sulfatase activity
MSRENEGMTRRRFGASVAAAAAACLQASKGAGAAVRAQDVTDAEMVKIPGGTAVIGTDPAEAEVLSKTYAVHPSWFSLEFPLRRVELRTFYLDKYPVTNAAYVAFVQDSKYPWSFLRHVMQQLDDIASHPVVRVNILDAQAYAEWAAKRLPTEEEWEYAARGPDGFAYPWGRQWDPSRCNTNGENVPNGRGMKPVGAYPTGASPFGVMDLAGNVCEWTNTPHTAACHVVKGGFWKQHEPYLFRAAYRGMTQFSSNQQEYLGFRCARDAE